MGERVTFRTRPRIDSFWVVGSTDTVANYAGNGWIGPFTRRQMMELWFRVKKFRVQASCDWENDTEDPPTSGTATIDVTLYRAKTSDFSLDEITEETDLLVEWNADAYLAFINATDMYFWCPENAPRSYMETDENGDYWFRGSTVAPFLAVADNTGFNVRAEGFVADLVVDLTFSDGTTVPLDLSLTVAAATSISNLAATVEIIEWFPYADKEGDPAWDTATGLQDNGGPGG